MPTRTRRILLSCLTLGLVACLVLSCLAIGAAILLFFPGFY
jgi:hypothetical protein